MSQYDQYIQSLDHDELQGGAKVIPKLGDHDMRVLDIRYRTDLGKDGSRTGVVWYMRVENGPTERGTNYEHTRWLPDEHEPVTDKSKQSVKLAVQDFARCDLRVNSLAMLKQKPFLNRLKGKVVAVNFTANKGSPGGWPNCWVNSIVEGAPSFSDQQPAQQPDLGTNADDTPPF